EILNEKYYMKHVPYRPLMISGGIGSFFIIISALFKIQHYPYSRELGLVGHVIFMFFGIWILISIVQSNLNPFHKILWFIGVLLLSVPVAWMYYFKYFHRKNR